MVYKIGFGTDGWRGMIAEDYTFDNVRRAAQGFASYLLEEGKKGQWVVVGYDKRFGSENFAAATAEILVGNELNVYLTEGATPTPVIAFSVVNKQACAAVNITASHNPPTDNGFKVRDENGGAIGPDGLKKIEALIPESPEAVKQVPFKTALAENKIVMFDPSVAYIDHIQKLVDIQKIKDAGFTVLVDAMWGNGAGWFTRLLGGGKTKVIEIHNVRNPIFPEMGRPEPIRPNIDVGLEATLKYNADVLIITDGDGDRLGVGDENGQFINQLRVYALLAYYMFEVKKKRGGIVKTLSTTSLLDELGKKYNVPVYETGVGFKYVAPKMIETDALIGGEESGGYAFRGHVPERDGILSGLFVLDLMRSLNLKPSELIEHFFSQFGESHYDRVDIVVTDEQMKRIFSKFASNIPKTVAGQKVISTTTYDGYKMVLEDGSWLLIRPSGTEPLIRVYSEAKTQDLLEKILADGQNILLSM